MYLILLLLQYAATVTVAVCSMENEIMLNGQYDRPDQRPSDYG